MLLSSQGLNGPYLYGALRGDITRKKTRNDQNQQSAHHYPNTYTGIPEHVYRPDRFHQGIDSKYEKSAKYDSEHPRYDRQEY